MESFDTLHDLDAGAIFKDFPIIATQSKNRKDSAPVDTNQVVANDQEFVNDSSYEMEANPVIKDKAQNKNALGDISSAKCMSRANASEILKADSVLKVANTASSEYNSTILKNSKDLSVPLCDKSTISSNNKEKSDNSNRTNNERTSKTTGVKNLTVLSNKENKLEQPASISINCDGSISHQPARRTSGLFRTGRDKDVTINDAALKKTKALFSSTIEQTANIDTATSNSINNNNDFLQEPARRTSGLFKTGRDRDVTIHEAALKKTEIIFASVNEEPSVSGNGTSLQEPARRTSGLFKTGRNRDVTIPEAAMKKTESLFGLVNEEPIVGSNSSSLQEPARRTSGLFKTGRDRDVTIPDAALKKTESLFASMNEEPSVGTNSSSSSSSLQEPARRTSGLFKTGRDRDVTIPEAALKKTESLFGLVNEEPSVSGNGSSSLQEPARRTSGLSKTGRDRDVAIPEAAMMKTENLFAPTNEEPIMGSNRSNLQEPARRTSGLFKTGRNRDVAIPEAAIKKTEILFASVNEEPSISGNSSSLQEPARRTSGLFKTGRDRDVTIPEAALKETKILFASTNEVPSVSSNSSSLQEPARRTSGLFKTGRDRDVKIHEAALKKTESFFGSVNEEPSVSSNSSSLQEPARRTSGLFKTGGDRNVTIPEAAIKKTESLFAPTNEEPIVGSNSSSSLQEPARRTSGLFKTGRDKDVTIPEVALKTTEILFESVNEEPSVREPARRTSGLFKTGKDRDVTIPEAAMKKTEILFASVNGEPVMGSSSSSSSSNPLLDVTNNAKKEALSFTALMSSFHSLAPKDDKHRTSQENQQTITHNHSSNLCDLKPHSQPLYNQQNGQQLLHEECPQHLFLDRQSLLKLPPVYLSYPYPTTLSNQPKVILPVHSSNLLQTDTIPSLSSSSSSSSSAMMPFSPPSCPSMSSHQEVTTTLENDNHDRNNNDIGSNYGIRPDNMGDSHFNDNKNISQKSVLHDNDVEYIRQKRLSVVNSINSGNCLHVDFTAMNCNNAKCNDEISGKDDHLNKQSRHNNDDDFSDMRYGTDKEQKLLSQIYINRNRKGELLKYSLNNLASLGSLQDGSSKSLPLNSFEADKHEVHDGVDKHGVNGGVNNHVGNSGQAVSNPMLQKTGPSLTPALEEWICMQLRWIVWTLASYERKYPGTFTTMILLDKVIPDVVIYYFCCYCFCYCCCHST
jgi:hypothetical protein